MNLEVERKCVGESALEFPTKVYNITMESERMTEKWIYSVLIPIFENKGESQSCIIGYSRGILNNDQSRHEAMGKSS